MQKGEGRAGAEQGGERGGEEQEKKEEENTDNTNESHFQKASTLHFYTQTSESSQSRLVSAIPNKKVNSVIIKGKKIQWGPQRCL